VTDLNQELVVNLIDVEQPMLALDTPAATHAISDPFDVERRGRDVKPLVECASVGVFRSIENPNQRPVFEVRLPPSKQRPEKHGIDAIDQCAQPSLAGNAVTARIFAENPDDARSMRRNRRTKRWSRKSAEETLPLGIKKSPRSRRTKRMRYSMGGTGQDGWKAAFLLMNSRREFAVFLPLAKSPDQTPSAWARLRVTLPPVGDLSRNTQFRHVRFFRPNLFGKFKSMVTPRHVPALPCL
jgi:hypothetical protein